MTARRRTLLLFTVLAVIAGTSIAVPVPRAFATTTYLRQSLVVKVSGTSVTASAVVTASPAAVADLYGICVRDSRRRIVDFGPKRNRASISTTGTSYTATRTFSPGTYTYFPCARVRRTWHVIGEVRTFTVRRPPVRAGWTGALDQVPVGSMGCHRDQNTATNIALRQVWDHWDNCGGSVVDPVQVGIPRPPGGSARVVRWTKTAGSDQVYQKLNRTFTKDNWPHGSPAKVALTGSPSDVSGVYSAYLYIPSSDFHLNPAHGWAQLLQLKETYLDATGRWHQDPIWAVGVNNFSGQSTGGGLWPDNTHTFKLADYQDRWVRWQLRVYQGAKDKTGHGGRIELWADDTLLQTGYERERHVGSGVWAPLARTQAFVWIAGPYTSNQTTRGVPDYVDTHATTYVGPSSVTPI